jgi:hypothetical protein
MARLLIGAQVVHLGFDSGNVDHQCREAILLLSGRIQRTEKESSAWQ